MMFCIAAPGSIQLGSRSIRAASTNEPSHRKESTVYWDELEMNWLQLKGRVKQRWGRLTDYDLAVIDGIRDELIARLHQLYGRPREELEREVDEFRGACAEVRS
jgi:uncharacterized protein YjbJ (UPF0337 family)